MRPLTRSLLSAAALRATSTPLAALGLLLTLGAAALASPRHHPPLYPPKSHAEAAHLARLAAQQKAAWHAHLAKVRALPHSDRVAMKRHDKHFARVQDRQHDAHMAAQQAHEARLAKRQAKAQHLAKAHGAGTAHAARLAARQAKAQHLARLAALQGAAHRTAAPAKHSSRAQSLVSAHDAHVRSLVAAHDAKVRSFALAHVAHEGKAAAMHNAHLRSLAAVHQAHVQAYQAAVGAHQSAHDVHVAQIQAKHLQALRARQQIIAQRALAHQARLAKTQNTHAAYVAAAAARRVALRGDNSGGRSIHFWQTVAAGVPVKVITVDLNDTDVKVSAVMSRRGSGTAEPFRQMIERANPNVAVTGTFFSLDNLQPVGDIVIDGSLVHFGGMGTALCITPGNRADMVTCEWGRHHDWTGYDFVCACGPRLLRRGRVVLDPRAERFRDRHMLAPNSRIAVGITRGNKIVFAMTHEPIYLGRLAKAMQALGASEAMNLDAGTSTGFYYNGATLARPGRQLTNMIVVYGQKQRYERALNQLVPAAYHRIGQRAGGRGQLSASVHP